mmetsp:Transcript_56249/g.142322  ORF Transcript_56249/g.142322 Transcript_56249/m.142322 type:complete len:81 (+) Transcript_56249:850-1092(+)
MAVLSFAFGPQHSPGAGGREVGGSATVTVELVRTSCDGHPLMELGRTPRARCWIGGGGSPDSDPNALRVGMQVNSNDDNR